MANTTATPRSMPLAVRFTPRQRATLDRAAALAEESVSAYVRRVALQVAAGATGVALHYNEDDGE